MAKAAALKRRPRSKDSERRSITINLRATKAWRALVDHAATMLEKTRTEFIMDAVRRHAEDVLLDQRVFALDDKSYRAFLNILDAPPLPNEELKRLMNTKSPWQK